METTIVYLFSRMFGLPCITPLGGVLPTLFVLFGGLWESTRVHPMHVPC